MTLGDMQSALYSDLRVGASPDATITAIITRYLNEGHRYILRKPALTPLRNGILTFASVIGQSTYSFPQAFETINNVRQITNDRPLKERSIDWLRAVDPGDRSSGTPAYYIPMGLSPVQANPASTGLWVASSSGADTTQTVRARVVRTGGQIPAAMSVVLTGTTRAQLAPTTLTDIVKIISFSISAVGAGDITLYDAAAAGNALMVIPANTSKAIQVQLVRLFPTPSTVDTYTVDGEIKILDLVNSDDIPLLPDSFHDLVPMFARWRWAEEYVKDFAWADRVKREFLGDPQDEERGGRLGELLSMVEFPPGSSARVGNLSNSIRWSNLGGWFPADILGSDRG